MARDLSRPPAGWANREGKSTLKAWRSLSEGYRSQILRARERGYGGSVYRMTRARATGDLAPADEAVRAAQRVPQGRYVTELGGGRWNFYARMIRDDGTPSLAGRRALTRNLERAARLANRNITAKLVDTNGLNATVGGRGGENPRDILELGEGDGLRGLLEIINRGYGKSDGDFGTVATVSLFVFPVDVELEDELDEEVA